jgi:hypothetical protein
MVPLRDQRVLANKISCARPASTALIRCDFDKPSKII